MKKSNKVWASILLTTALVSPQAAFAQEGEGSEPPSTVDEISVLGEYIPNSKLATSEISAFLDEEDFKIQGDSDVAGALTRVTGLSLSQGKFIYVRGLNERYSNVTLNGSPLPSPEPLKRVAPLDIIPTSVLSSVMVQKTFSPEFSGEMGGGVVDMRTRALPEETYVELSTSLGGTVGTTFENGLTYDGGDNDWFGFDDGIRNLPAPLASVFDQRVNSSMTDEQRQEIGRSLVNSPLWVLQSLDATPNDFSGGVQGGTRFDVSDSVSLGIMGSAGLSNSWQTKEGVRREGQLASDGGIDAGDDYVFKSTENKVSLNTFLSVGADILDNHIIQATGLMVRSTSKEGRMLAGYETGEGEDIRQDNLEWFERQVWTGQLAGSHFFGEYQDIELNWRFSHSEAFRDAPYQRQVTYVLEGDEYRYKGTQDANYTRFSKIEDETEDYGVDLLFPAKLFGYDMDLKAGLASVESRRDAWLREYALAPGGAGLPGDLLYSRIDYIFADININDNRLQLVETGGVAFPEAYYGTLDVDAFYGGVDIELNQALRAAVGVRYEESSQYTDTFNRSLPDNGATDLDAPLDEEYYLPAATLTWTYAENTQLRFGYSKTIIRPQFRELAFAEFINSETDASFKGNPFLVNTEMTNYDVRWEHYFGSREFFTIGGFYKDIEKPIEEFVTFSGDSAGTSFLNAPSAVLFGAEFEYEKSIDISDWTDWAWLDTKDFFVKANYTWTDSEVSNKGDIIIAVGSVASGAIANVQDATSQISYGRPLQGMSESLFNLQFGFEDYETGARATLLVNYTGERSRAVEDIGNRLPAIMERPPLGLDLVISRPFTVHGGEYEFGFKAKNLLSEDYEASQSGKGSSIVVDGYELGQSFSFSLSRRF